MAQQRIKHRLILRNVTTRAARGRGNGGIRFGGAGSLRPAFPRYSSTLIGETPEGVERAKMVSQTSIMFNADTSKVKRQVSETQEFIRGWWG